MCVCVQNFSKTKTWWKYLKLGDGLHFGDLARFNVIYQFCLIIQSICNKNTQQGYQNVSKIVLIQSELNNVFRNESKH